MKRTSLQHKFVLSTVLITLAVLVLSSTVTLLFSMNVFRGSNETSLEQAALLGQQEAEKWFNEKEQFLNLAHDDLTSADFNNTGGIQQRMEALDPGSAGVDHLYLGTADNGFISSIFWEPPDTYDVRDRTWYQQAQAGQITYTVPYVDAVTGKTVITLSKPFEDRSGRVTGVMAIDVGLDTLVNFIQHQTILNTSGQAFLLDDSLQIITHANDAFLPISVGEHTQYTSILSTGITYDPPPTGQAALLTGKDWDGAASYVGLAKIPNNDWIYGFAVPVGDFNAVYLNLVLLFAVISAVMALIAILLSRHVTKRLLVPVESMIHTASALAAGNVDVDLNVKTGDELEELADQFQNMIRSTTRQIEIMEAMAQGDFSGQIQPRSPQDRLSFTINSVTSQLRQLVDEIASSSTQVAKGAMQIAQSSQYLSQGAMQQSQSLDQLSGALDNMTDGTKETVKLAAQSHQNIRLIREQAGLGKRSMNQLVDAVQDIDDAAGSITSIIKVIEDIAFQTNILALNAAVEAARAGQYGRGFAVVADEVRRLAVRSSAAAQQTAELVESSYAKAGSGLEIATETQRIFQEIAQSIDATVQLVQEIDQSTDRQEQEIIQINHYVRQISQVVQENSSAAQQGAATSQQMNSQAQLLQETIRSFHTAGKVEVAPPPPGEKYGDGGMALLK